MGQSSETIPSKCYPPRPQLFLSTPNTCPRQQMSARNVVAQSMLPTLTRRLIGSLSSSSLRPSAVSVVSLASIRSLQHLALCSLCQAKHPQLLSMVIMLQVRTSSDNQAEDTSCYPPKQPHLLCSLVHSGICLAPGFMILMTANTTCKIWHNAITACRYCQ